jgi:uncharacterized membrane protein
MQEALAAQGLPVENQPVKMRQLSIAERIALDPIANTVAIIVLSSMLISVFMIGSRFLDKHKKKFTSWPDWVIPILVVIGLGVAGYLSYVELTHTDAVCGPVGDCNTVQQSSYARLFGFLSIGTFGIIGYTLIAIAWAVERFGAPSMKDTAAIGLWALAGFGTLFSIYLTFLEPFVIGATCMWCITSAIIMTALLWATTPRTYAILKPSKRQARRR